MYVLAHILRASKYVDVSSSSTLVSSSVVQLYGAISIPINRFNSSDIIYNHVLTTAIYPEKDFWWCGVELYTNNNIGQETPFFPFSRILVMG